MKMTKESYILVNLSRTGYLFRNDTYELIKEEQKYHFGDKRLSTLKDVMEYLKRKLPEDFFQKSVVYNYTMEANKILCPELCEKENANNICVADYRVMVYDVYEENEWDGLQCVSELKKLKKIKTENWYL